MKRLLAALLLATPLSTLAATEVLPLSNRSAEELAPVVRSMLGEAGRVESYGNQLVVNAPSGRIEEIRQLVQQLDTPARRLLISVDTRRGAAANQDGYSVNGRISAGGVSIGTDSAGNSTRIIRHSTSERDGGVQRVQATEGYPARIQLGQSVPLQVTRSDAYGRPYQDTEYRELANGFYATAQVQGEQVSVSISTQSDRLARQPGAIDVQGTQTRVSGRLGEWMEIAGASQQSANDDTGLVRHYSSSSGEDLSIRLKVDLAE